VPPQFESSATASKGRCRGTADPIDPGRGGQGVGAAALRSALMKESSGDGQGRVVLLNLRVGRSELKMSAVPLQTCFSDRRIIRLPIPALQRPLGLLNQHPAQRKSQEAYRSIGGGLSPATHHEQQAPRNSERTAPQRHVQGHQPYVPCAYWPSVHGVCCCRFSRLSVDGVVGFPSIPLLDAAPRLQLSAECKRSARPDGIQSGCRSRCIRTW